MSNTSRQSGFTLLELVVVLMILAVLTTLATRALDQVQDQHRYDASQRGLREIEAAVLGDPDDRASDGTRIISGFVSDMGRLPRAVLRNGRLTLRELWFAPEYPPFDARRADASHGVPIEHEDLDIIVPGGWRGPYLRLPIDADELLDGWGNPYTSPTAGSTDDARLLDASNLPLTAAGQEIVTVRHLGSDGRDSSESEGFNRDQAISFDGRFTASLKASVQIINEDDASLGSGEVTVRVFGPSPNDASKVLVLHASEPLSGTLSSLIPVPSPDTAPDGITGLTVGRRAVRAYLKTSDGTVTSVIKSPVKYLDLQSGLNFVEFTIRRKKNPEPPATP